MNKLLLLFLAVTITVSVFADGPTEFRAYESDDYKEYRAEAAGILASIGDSPMGELTLFEMNKLAIISLPICLDWIIAPLTNWIVSRSFPVIKKAVGAKDFLPLLLHAKQN